MFLFSVQFLFCQKTLSVSSYPLQIVIGKFELFKREGLPQVCNYLSCSRRYLYERVPHVYGRCDLHDTAETPSLCILNTTRNISRLPLLQSRMTLQWRCVRFTVKNVVALSTFKCFCDFDGIVRLLIIQLHWIVWFIFFFFVFDLNTEVLFFLANCVRRWRSGTSSDFIGQQKGSTSLFMLLTLPLFPR